MDIDDRAKLKICEMYLVALCELESDLYISCICNIELHQWQKAIDILRRLILVQAGFNALRAAIFQIKAISTDIIKKDLELIIEANNSKIARSKLYLQKIYINRNISSCDHIKAIKSVKP